MKLMENSEYIGYIAETAELFDWSGYKDKSFMFSGATGMVGSAFIDMLMYVNKTKNTNIKVIALGRNEEKARNRFSTYWDDPDFRFIECDLANPIEYQNPVDYIFHLASSTHPLQYSTDPVGTLLINIEGLKNLLDYAGKAGCKRFVFTSSVEIYGENRGDTKAFDEKYLGYIDCNTVRACYPEGKRAAEALCQAYIKQHGLDIIIPRLSRIYGPTMLQSDTKAISQFIKNGIKGEDIILKSKGTQLYSYCFVFDIISALMFLLSKGSSGEAYNISGLDSDITLKDLAATIASYKGKEVVFQLPDETEKQGYSTATVATLDTKKISELGWRPKYSIKKGILDTLKILEDIK